MRSVDPAHWAQIEHRVLNVVAQQGFMKHVGAEVLHLAPGECTTTVAHRPELLQNLGYFHGGCIAFLLDNATAIAASTLIRAGQAVLTAEYKLNFLNPGRGERLICRARVIKPGRTLSVVTGVVYAVDEGAEKHVATALATIAVVTLPAQRGRMFFFEKKNQKTFALGQSVAAEKLNG